jgi:DNA-binding MarR family transcriptional regulator
MHPAEIGFLNGECPRNDRSTNRIISAWPSFATICAVFLKFSERAASETGLRPQQHQALLAIKGAPGQQVTIGILAERLGIRHNSAVELIDRLIMNGLVERRQNPSDRREVLVDLTNRAERILAKLSLAHRNEIRKLAPLLIGLLARFESGSRNYKRRKPKT